MDGGLKRIIAAFLIIAVTNIFYYTSINLGMHKFYAAILFSILEIATFVEILKYIEKNENGENTN